MCGIFASSGLAMHVMTQLSKMRHRGPDQSHYKTFRNGSNYERFTIGFNRLMIVDSGTPGAVQPWVTPKGNVVAFNGEVYNYLRLGRDLETEVMLIGRMIDEGYDPRQFFDGDYAILHFNPSTGIMTLYRDRFGVCPLYYSTHPVEVSSEARRLKKPREVPAHGKVVIDTRARRVLRRDIMPLYGATGSFVQSQDVTRALEEAVASRANHTESGYSIALSGGLDSSAILMAAMRAQVGMPATCIVTGFSDESEDVQHARLLAERMGVHLTTVIIPKKIPEAEAAMIREHFDCPAEQITKLRWQGALRSWHVAKYAPTRVILCGDGADELLGGYVPHHLAFEGANHLRVNRKRISSLRSMQHFNLDRTNKMGMAWSKEFRAPFLASSLSQLLLSSPFYYRKDLLRDVLREMGAPEEILARERKYSPDELAVV